MGQHPLFRDGQPATAGEIKTFLRLDEGIRRGVLKPIEGTRAFLVGDNELILHQIDDPLWPNGATLWVGGLSPVSAGRVKLVGHNHLYSGVLAHNLHTAALAVMPKPEDTHRSQDLASVESELDKLGI